MRPSSDRVRESLFARLADLAGARVLDLYAGSGALGIEALSRGAEHALFVDSAVASIGVLEDNLAMLGLADLARVMRGDCAQVLRALGESDWCFDLVMLDPPYDSDELEPTLCMLVEARLLSPQSTVVVETAKRHPVLTVAGLALLDQRDYGDTRITRMVMAQ